MADEDLSLSELKALRRELEEAYASGQTNIRTANGANLSFDTEAGLWRRLQWVKRRIAELEGRTARRPGITRTHYNRGL